MPVTEVNVFTDKTSGGASGKTIALSDVVLGDRIIIVHWSRNAAAAESPLYDSGTGDDAGFDTIGSSTETGTMTAFDKIADADDVGSPVYYLGLVSGNDKQNLCAILLRGDDDLDPTPVFLPNDADATPDSPPITTVRDASLVYHFLGMIGAGTTVTTEPGDTDSVFDIADAGGGGIRFACVKKTQASAGDTGAASWEISSAQDSVGLTIAIKPEPAASEPSTMSRYNYDMGDFATAASLPSGITDRFSAANTAFAIEADAGSPGGKYLKITKTGAGKPLAAFDDANGDNQMILAQIETNGNNNVQVWINGGGSSGSETGYFVELEISSNRFEMWKSVAGTPNLLGYDANTTLTANTKYWVRLCRFSNGTLKGRIWTVGSQEPTDWQLSETGQNDYTTGWAGIGDVSTSSVTKVHYVSIGTAYVQGCEVKSEDFPSEGLYLVSSEDESIRYTSLDGSVHFLIAVSEGNAKKVWVHQADRELYLADYTLGIIKYDRYGITRTVIDGVTTGVYGIAIKESTGEIFYATRTPTTGYLYKNAKAGGARVQIFSEAGAYELGDVYYNEDDDRLYLAKHPAPIAMETDGSSVQTYPNFTNALTIIADDTNVYVSTWDANAFSSVPLAGGSYTVRDATSSLWSFAFNDDKSELYAAADDQDEIIKWSAVPPSAANRSAILTGFDGVGDVGVAYFKFASGGGASDRPGCFSLGLPIGL